MKWKLVKWGENPYRPDPYFVRGFVLNDFFYEDYLGVWYKFVWLGLIIKEVIIFKHGRPNRKRKKVFYHPTLLGYLLLLAGLYLLYFIYVVSKQS